MTDDSEFLTMKSSMYIEFFLDLQSRARFAILADYFDLFCISGSWMLLRSSSFIPLC